MKTSIIILVQDRYDCIQRCISSILEHTVSEYEFIFILQNIPKDSPVRDLVYNINREKVIYDSDINLGVTPGRNKGMELATGDFLLFFDDDAWISEELEHIPEEERQYDWLERLYRYFDNSQVGVVGQTGYYVNRKRRGVFDSVENRGGFCDVCQGYCFMFSREVYNTLGGLDVNYGKFWHEESDYALMAKERGFRVVNAGYIGVGHQGSGSGDDGTYSKKIDYLFKKFNKVFDTILEKR